MSDVKIIQPKKISEICFPNWKTFIEFDHEERQISVVIISDGGGYPESLRHGVKYWARVQTQGRKLREVKALLEKVAPIYAEALEHYSSRFDDEEFKYVGRLDSDGEALMRKIDGEIEYF